MLAGERVEVHDEVHATEFDKTYRYKKGKAPIIEGLTKYDIDKLKLESILF